MKNTIVINLVGGPCSGKSTTASGLFREMKLRTKQKVELVNEVIKKHVYDDNKGFMNDQVLITALQNHELKSLDGKVDFIISDASLLNAVVYNEFYDDIDNVSTELSMKLMAGYNNLTFLLPRKPEYDEYGRSQSLEEAKQIDDIFVKKLDEVLNDYYDMRKYTHEEMPERILDILKNKFNFTVK